MWNGVEREYLNDWERSISKMQLQREARQASRPSHREGTDAQPGMWKRLLVSVSIRFARPSSPTA
jgi:hypothetical protein